MRKKIPAAQILAKLRQTREALWEKGIMLHAKTSHSSSVARRRREAKESLFRLRGLVASQPSSFAGLSIAQAVERMRSVREDLWNHKFALRP